MTSAIPTTRQRKGVIGFSKSDVPSSSSGRIPESSGAWDGGTSLEPLVSDAYKPSADTALSEHRDGPMVCPDAGGQVNFRAPRTPQRSVANDLRAWSESPTSPHRQLPKREERENWDADFLDSAESPARPPSSAPAGTLHHVSQRAQAGEDLDDENWDEDFELGINKNGLVGGPSSSTRRPRHGQMQNTEWDLSSKDMDVFTSEMGFDCNDEEDKTVTSRPRRKPLGSLSDDPLPLLPPLPPLPTFVSPVSSDDPSGPYAYPSSPFSRSSPSHSVFSIPATTTSGGHRDRESTYGSTAHLALSLRRTHSAESSPNSPLQKTFIISNRFPQGSDMLPKERRRLRKKSRPPHLDPSILELDDKGFAESIFMRPSTPGSRPCTPPLPDTDIAAALPPSTPSSTPVSDIASAPLSPTSASKSPLLARLGSMRRWGRKRASTTTCAESSFPGRKHTDRKAFSQPDGAPPTTYSNKTMDAEADRFDNNRTPRPQSQATSSWAPPRTLPIIQPGSAIALSTAQTPSRNRFFRASPSGVDQNTSDKARPATPIEIQDMKRTISRETGRLRISTSQVVSLEAQSSQSGESEGGITTSPRAARIRAFRQKLMKRSPSGSSVERGKDSSDGDSSQVAIRGLADRHVSAPLNSETPTRLRPRLPSSRQGPSSLKTRPVVPRHFSGSAMKETGPHSSPAPSISASGRSISASGSARTVSSSEDLHHSDRGSDEKPGHRGLMGSLRRISLRSARQHQQHLADDQAQVQNPMSMTTLLPSIHSELSTDSVEPVKSGISLKGSATSTSGAEIMHVNLASLTSGLPSDWPSIAPPRHSGDMPVLTHSKSSSFATSSSLSQSTPALRLNSVTQVVSLGRASPLPIDPGPSSRSNVNINTNVLRRNSLGDLKIPSRISRVQDGLKKDLGRVREFAARVQQLQDLRANYFAIAAQIQSIIDAPCAPSQATSPTGSLFGLSRSNSRARLSTNPPTLAIDYRDLANGFRAIDTRYSVAWECADLLIELGTGNVSEPVSGYPAPSDTGTKEADSSVHDKKREHAMTLSDDGGKADLSQVDMTSPRSPPTSSPPPLVSWRTSNMRHDLERRQLYLLRQMLSNTESIRDGAHLDVSDVATEWTEGNEAMDSTLTLPTDESGVVNPTHATPKKKRRASRLIGIRDMLRSLKRSTARAIQNHSEAAVAYSSTTLNTEYSLDSNSRQGDSHPHSFNTVAGIPSPPGDTRRNSGTASALSGPIHSPDEDYSLFSGKLALSHKSSPRRPSLASLFRLGQKQKVSSTPSSTGSSRDRGESEITPDSDLEEPNHADTPQETTRDDVDDSEWDKIDSTSDVEMQMAAIVNGSSGRRSTMKLQKKKQQNRLSMPPTGLVSLKHHALPFNSSQGSFKSQNQSMTNTQSPRLSDVEENEINMSSTVLSALSGSGRQTPDSSHRSRSRVGRNKDREKQFSSVRTIPQKTGKGISSFESPPPPHLPSTSLKLAMTPENIKPLLENARVVTSRLHDCLVEVKGLLLRTEGAAAALSASVTSAGTIL